jgi:hypothetical protein
MPDLRARDGHAGQRLDGGARLIDFQMLSLMKSTG